MALNWSNVLYAHKAAVVNTVIKRMIFPNGLIFKIKLNTENNPLVTHITPLRIPIPIDRAIEAPFNAKKLSPNANAIPETSVKMILRLSILGKKPITQFPKGIIFSAKDFPISKSGLIHSAKRRPIFLVTSSKVPII